MMATEGQGDVLYGYRGLHVTLLDLDGSSPLVCEADRLLAHDAALQTSVQFLGLGRPARGGQRGDDRAGPVHHQRARPRRGRPAVPRRRVPAAGARARPSGVDPQAYVGHVGQLSVDVVAKAGFRDVVGRGSGEAFQLRITGHGIVYVQPSEQKF